MTAHQAHLRRMRPAAGLRVGARADDGTMELVRVLEVYLGHQRATIEHLRIGRILLVPTEVLVW